MPRLYVSRGLKWCEANANAAPRFPGVYALFDESRSPLYVGVADDKALRGRLLQRFHGNDIPEARYFDWYQPRTPDEARRLGRQLVKAWKPRYNTALGSALLKLRGAFLIARWLVGRNLRRLGLSVSWSSRPEKKYRH